MTISTQSFLSINVGTTANDGTGDDLRTAFIKVNDNFQYMGNTGFNAGNIAATGITATSLSVIGDTSITGNLSTTGAHVETGYRQLKPTGNIAVTANVGTNATLVNSPTYTAASPTYFTFDRNSQEYATTSSFNLTNWTVEAWFRTTTSLSNYITAIVIHINGNNGCKIFGEVQRERDYDQKKDKPRYRLMNEVYKVSELYLKLSDVLDGREVEVHLDINPNEMHGSSCVINEAVGYIRGTCNVIPLVKPNAFAASYAADRFKGLKAA